MTESELKNKQKALEYSRTFSTESGKKVLEDLAIECGYNNTSVCESSPDALQTMYKEGKRRVYLRIIGFIEKGLQNERVD